MNAILVTGKSGSGKSTLSKKLALAIGYKYVDIDQIAHSIYNHSEVIETAEYYFGKGIYNEDGTFNRKNLGKLFFAESGSKKVEEFSLYTWTFMKKIIDDLLYKNNCVLDYIQLPNTEYWQMPYTKILVNGINDQTRFDRIIKRDNVTKEYLKSRETATLEYNESDFDYVLTNTYLDDCFDDFILNFKQNLKGDLVMKIGFYAGSFDPFTNGHLHIIKIASKVFDKVIVGLGVNPKKSRRYDANKMLDAINQVLKNNNLNNCECILYDGLTVDVAKQHNTTLLIRGIRNGMDYDYEENLALINEEISNLDTIYFRAGEFGYISSSMVYELLKNNKDVSKYLPKEILNII